MENTLREILIKYKTWTEEILKRLSSEEYDLIEECLINRQVCIDTLNSSGYENSEFISIAKEIKLLEIEQLANYTMNKKRLELKEKINETSRTRIANKNYNKNIHNSYNIFNAKV